MPLLEAAGISALGSIASGIIGSNAAGQAAGQQTSALNNATGLQQKMFSTINGNNGPFLNSGIAANDLLSVYLGTAGNTPISSAQVYTPQFQSMAAPIYASYGVSGPGQSAAADQAADTAYQQAQQVSNASNPNYGSLLQPFTSADLTANLAPNYAFSLHQGQTATTNAANLAGGAVSGNALKALDDYTQNYAQGAYQQAYQNYNTNQGNIYNRLSGAITTGQNSANQVGTAGTQLANGMAQTTAAAGAAQAGGTIGSANAISGAINNASSMYQLANLTQNTNNLAAGNYLSGYQDIVNNSPINPLTYSSNYG